MRSLDNIIITPHVAFFSQESTLGLARRAAAEVVSVRQGRMPNNLVNLAVLGHPNPRRRLVKGSGGRAIISQFRGGWLQYGLVVGMMMLRAGESAVGIVLRGGDVLKSGLLGAGRFFAEF